MASPNIPDPLRERLLRQSRRVRLVRISFALSIAAVLVVSFCVALFQGISPVMRRTSIYMVKGGEKPEALLLDQNYDPSPNIDDGSFRLARLRDGEATPGASFRGVASSVARLDDKRVAVVFDAHLLEFDISGDASAEGWPKLLNRQNLGINDPDASPTVAVYDGKPWLCWLAGSDVRLRPLNDLETQFAPLVAEMHRGSQLNMISAEGYLWLSVTDKQSGALKLLWFKPRVDPVLPQGGDAPREGGLVTHVESLHTSEVTREVRTSSLTVLEGKPVFLLSRRDKERQGDKWELWRYKDDGWARDEAPEFPSNSLLVSMSAASISASDGTLAVAYSDGRQTSLALGKLENGKLAWRDVQPLTLGDARGLGPTLIWLAVVLALSLLVAGQGMWLLLNRSQELDRTLATLLSDKPTTDKKLPKEETMLYANLMARSIALLVDLGITSPVVIMLKSVYHYEWSQAYGFLLPMNMATEPRVLMAALLASVVTLSILTIYAMVCEMIWGRTFGKALLHLRVVDKDGEQPSTWQIVVRNLVRIIEVAHWVVLLVPAMLMVMSGKQQRLGDMLARTYVIVEVVPEDQADDLEI
jgi:uncharacterized RDD family membrane protein YckC